MADEYFINSRFFVSISFQVLRAVSAWMKLIGILIKIVNHRNSNDKVTF